jgi:hypothetical protein
VGKNRPKRVTGRKVELWLIILRQETGESNNGQAERTKCWKRCLERGKMIGGTLLKVRGEMEEYYRKKDEGVKDSVVGHK